MREVEILKYKKKEGRVKGEIWLPRAQHNLPLSLPNKKKKTRTKIGTYNTSILTKRSNFPLAILSTTVDGIDA